MFMTSGWNANLILHILGDHFFLHNRLVLVLALPDCTWFIRSVVILVGVPPQDFEFLKLSGKMNFSVYNALMECKLLLKNYLEK